MNVIGERSALKGKINCKGDLFIRGRFEGKIVTEGVLYVYPEAVVKGTVQARDLMVAGSMHGEIKVSRRLRVKNSAYLEARISTRFIDWEEGATLDGELDTYF